MALILCVAAVEAWRTDRRDRAQLASELASTKQLLAAADARQRDRDTQLAQTLSALAAQERSIVTPTQIVRELSKTIPLPEPVTLHSGHESSAGAALGSHAANARDAASNASNPTTTNGSSTATAAASSQSIQRPPAGAVIPAADLKPIYEFTLDCQACKAKLSTTQSDLADEKTKTAALTKERDDALRFVKGGSTWRRMARAAKWFLLGAAAGAVVSKAR